MSECPLCGFPLKKIKYGDKVYLRCHNCSWTDEVKDED